MPIYEYECSSCGGVEEVIQRFSDEPLCECRVCRGKLHKLISHSTFHLKGSGWYVTDYAGKSGKVAGNAKPAETSATSKKSSDDASKSTPSSASEGSAE